MDAAFFRRLYQGYAAEHQVSSVLFRDRFEVFRLPADFGFDLIVTDQFRRAEGNAAPHLPFALQVKSRWMSHDAAVPGPNGRREFQIDYRMKRDEIDLVLATEDSGLVFVFYLGYPIGPRFAVRMFWLHRNQIPFLVDGGYFRPHGASYDFTVRHRDFPLFTPAAFIATLPIAYRDDPVLCEFLQTQLPPEFRRNWAAEEYLSFARLPRNEMEDLVYRSPSNLGLNLDLFPNQELLHGLD